MPSLKAIRRWLAEPEQYDDADIGDRLPLIDFGRRHFADWLTQSPSRFHLEFIEDLNNASINRGAKLARIAPRGFAKSTWVDIAIVKGAVDGSEPYTLLVKNNSVNARKELEIIRERIEKIGVPIQANSANSLTLRNGSRIDALGSEQSPKGVRHKGRRPSLIIADDIESTTVAVSPASRESLLSRFRTDFLPAGEPGHTNFIFVGTPAHLESVVQKVRLDPEWDSKAFQAVERFPTDMDLWKQWAAILFDLDNPNRMADAEAFHREHYDDMNEGASLLWPERFPLPMLMRAYLGLGKAAFLSEFQASPYNPDSAFFQPEWFHDAKRFDEWEPKYASMIVAVDPAVGKDISSGDESAIAIFGVHDNGRRDVDIDSSRRTPAMLVAALVRIITERKPTLLAIETVGFQEMIVDLLNKELAAAKIARPPIWRVEQAVSKETRIMRLASPLAQGKYRFKNKSEGIRKLIEQGQSWPASSRDDILDAAEIAERSIARGAMPFGGMR